MKSRFIKLPAPELIFETVSPSDLPSSSNKLLPIVCSFSASIPPVFVKKAISFTVDETLSKAPLNCDCCVALDKLSL